LLVEKLAIGAIVIMTSEFKEFIDFSI